MERFGDELRGERERRGVSIDMICSMTKVSSRHLQALEANRFGDMPGGVFRKGIVKGYLEALGFDETAESSWLDRFEQALRSEGLSTEINDWSEFATNVKRNRLPTPRVSAWRWIGVIFLLALLGGLGWAAWNYVLQPRLRAQHIIAGIWLPSPWS